MGGPHVKSRRVGVSNEEDLPLLAPGAEVGSSNHPSHLAVSILSCRQPRRGHASHRVGPASGHLVEVLLAEGCQRCDLADGPLRRIGLRNSSRLAG